MIDDLYDAIGGGGRLTVAAATESFYRRVLEDETPSHFLETTDMAHLVARQSMFFPFCSVEGWSIQAKRLAPLMQTRGQKRLNDDILTRSSSNFGQTPSLFLP